MLPEEIQTKLERIARFQKRWQNTRRILGTRYRHMYFVLIPSGISLP